MKFYKIASYLCTFSYILLGLLTIGSIINGTIGLYINLIMGVLFTTIGYYLYAKAKSTIKLIDNIKKLNNEKQVTLNSIAQFLLFEKLFIVISLLFGIILLSAVISRVFGENLPVFG
ncbi:hypothetical protein [Sunxiuqinia sp. sy24]|uniref:hypothetical protein n=1 Tax=Sunxiuqinia sp. sy24 TaxID=3461495 RepID=UPI00404648DE